MSVYNEFEIKNVDKTKHGLNREVERIAQNNIKSTFNGDWTKNKQSKRNNRKLKYIQCKHKNKTIKHTYKNKITRMIQRAKEWNS